MQPVLNRPASSAYPSPTDNWEQDPETGYLFNTLPANVKGNQDFSLEKKKLLIGTYQSTFPDLTEAIHQVGISRQTVYWHLKFDRAFAAAFQEIRESCADRTESRLYKDSLTPKQFMAQIAILRAYRPGLYTEKRINLTSRDLDPSTLQHKSGSLHHAIDAELVEPQPLTPANNSADPAPRLADPAA